jgi:16S rRNA A1518/A1519 N6-dimethyltransferase RsmA/KsgA/DIM1 with predicted DNA glycosylase/AP lyase activity
LAFFSIILSTIKNGISPMPSHLKAKTAILNLIKSHVPQTIAGDILELGSGFLTLAIPIARMFPLINVIAFETSHVPYHLSQFRKHCSKCSNLSVLKQDFFKADFKNAGLVICYLYPRAMTKLKVKFDKELKPGTFILSNTFAIPGLEAVKTVTLNDIYNTKIYLYIM